ncbi:MAG TPA: hypothetical protein VFR26_13985 [Acidimicrobiales bacterium]|nr:hypothetical protein [Acidimicrobiales bacterium]
MTAPTERPIEERLRAHYEDGARTMQIPGPEADAQLARARQGLGLERRRGDDRARRRHRRPGPLVAAAAVVAVIAVFAGIALARRDDTADVSTDPRPPAPTPTTEPVPPTTAATPDTTVAPAPPLPEPAPVGPIVGFEGILGSWDGSEWVHWNPEDPVPSATEFRVVRLSGPATTVTGRPVVRGCGATDRPTIDVGLENAGFPVRMGVAVAGLDDLQPRPVEELDPTAEVYRAAAAEVAISMGVGEPAPEVAQVVRADLDGDGLAEVLVMAEQHGQPGSSLAAPGDWSAAFVRRVVGGAVQTTVVESHLTTDVDAPLLPQYRVGAIADLNGDGRLEVVLNMSYYEGSETTIREVGADGNLREVLSAACGV